MDCVFSYSTNSLELATYPVQYFTCFMLEVAQVLGIAIRCGIDGMGGSNGVCTSYVGRYYPYYPHYGFCHYATQTIEYFATISDKISCLIYIKTEC